MPTREMMTGSRVSVAASSGAAVAANPSDRLLPTAAPHSRANAGPSPRAGGRDRHGPSCVCDRERVDLDLDDAGGVGGRLAAGDAVAPGVEDRGQLHAEPVELVREQPQVRRRVEGRLTPLLRDLVIADSAIQYSNRADCARWNSSTTSRAASPRAPSESSSRSSRLPPG